MIKITLCILLIIYTGSLSLSISNDLTYCFKYTWRSSESNNKPEGNCSTVHTTPCIEDPITSLTPPDPHQFWTDKNIDKLCTTTSKGDVCIKFNLWYNGNIVNMSAYCGKVTEDNSIPITSGCFEQHVNGYIREVCACESRKGGEPCNMSVRTGYSFILIISVLLLTFMFTY